jgi:hypothetical protein
MPRGNSDVVAASARTASPTGRGGHPFAFAVFVLLLILFPLVGHGCHGDDVDHEPAVLPPVHAPTSANSR